MKEMEFERRKKEQEVQRLKIEFIRKKRDDAKKIHDAIAEAENQEKLMQQNLLKEKLQLNDVKQ
jgi:hypothetical protein